MPQAYLQIFMGILGSFGFSILYNVRGGKLFLTALGGGLGWTLFLLLGSRFPGEPLRYFICAAVVTFYAEILARLMKTPATTFLIPSLIPMIPGGALYRTMRFAVEKNWSDCLTQAFYTFRLALALAMGVAAVLTVYNVYGILRTHFQKEVTPL